MRDFRDGLRWLIALALLVNCLALGSNRVLTDHEVHLAATTRHMVESGDWLVPRIGDHTWLEKPPLPQWLAAGTAMLLGRFDEWSMRLPFALAGVGVVLLAAQIATQLFGPRVGLLSGFIQATCVYQVTYSRLAEGDVLLQCLVLGAISVFLSGEAHGLRPVGEQDSANPRDATRGLLFVWIFWLLVGGMNLVKGIAFGSVLTLLTCSGWFLLGSPGNAFPGSLPPSALNSGDPGKAFPGLLRIVRGWWNWCSPLPTLIALVIAVAWPIAAAMQEPDAMSLWRDHLFGRAAGSLGYTQPWWYYLTTWPVQLLPWTPFLFVALSSGGRKSPGSALDGNAAPDKIGALNQGACAPRSEMAFCVWWALSQAALLSLSSGKHHHYLIYSLPGLTPLMALGVLRCWDAYLLHTELRDPGMAIPGLLGALVIAGHMASQLAIMPLRDPSRADKQFLAEVDRLTPPDIPVAACGSQEISRHLFYVQRPVVGIWNAAEVPDVLPQSPDVYVIARGFARSELEEWGRVEQVAQSRFTRRERNPEDRYTLFLVHRKTEVATAREPLKR